MSKLSLRVLRNTQFMELYQKLLQDKVLNKVEKSSLLSLAILFLRCDNVNVQKLGYGIILRYSNGYEDYTPLYDIAINLGYIPIAKFIENMPKNRDSFDTSFLKSFMSAFKENFYVNNVYLTQDQLLLNEFVSNEKDRSLAVIAPTSYGKSELINLSINENINLCIIVPTKALLAQTKRRILNAKVFKGNKKIITHPEMYIDGDREFIAVLTQERLLRLLQQDTSLTFDTVYVDEAHNLLEDDPRARLLATCIKILEVRNKYTKFKFLSPFLTNTDNLMVHQTNYTIKHFPIDETLKIEQFYYCDVRKLGSPLKIYDQFLNQSIVTSDKNYNDDIGLILEKKARKNLVYLNRPTQVESFAKRLHQKLNIVESKVIDKACKDLSEYVHKEYSIVKCLRKGVVYHHGSVPDIVRLYLENLYTTEPLLSFIVTTSTLLEGVNIPAERLFLLNNKKGKKLLSPSQFKNLVGRVCRFKELFDPTDGDLNMLEPQIYLIASEYLDKRSNIEKFLMSRVKADKPIEDVPVNVLLKRVEHPNPNELTKAEEFIENIEPGSIRADNKRHAKNEVGKRCFANNIIEIDIIDNEEELQATIEDVYNNQEPANSSREVIDLFVAVFLPYILDDKLLRFEKEKTRSFYSMILDWRLEGAAYGKMIGSFLRHWKQEVERDPDILVYAGKWGDRCWPDRFYPSYVEIRSKTKIERINLAIVRIKEEQDFIDHTLRKFIEVLNDLSLIERDLYNRIKYGTSTTIIIMMIKNGLSLGLATMLYEEYKDFIMIDESTSTLDIDSRVIDAMKANNVNDLVIFEVKLNIRNN